MLFFHHYVDRETEKPKASYHEHRDSLTCHYINEYRDRQHQRELQHIQRSPSHKVYDAMSRILNSRKLISAKLAGLSQRIREAYKPDRPYGVSEPFETDCDCGVCLQRQRIAIFYREMYMHHVITGEYGNW